MAERFVIPSTARAEDGAFLAMADVAELAASTGTEYRIIGAHMVSVHTSRHRLDLPLRQTGDADVGLQAKVLATSGLVEALIDRGYEQEGGNRFVRKVDGLDLAIDLLVPAYTSKIRHNRPVGDLFVDEVPGLGYALARDPLITPLRVRLESGRYVDMSPHFPDAVAALCLKVLAFGSRREKRDAIDVWRMLEVVNADGVTAADWPDRATPRQAAERMRSDFLPANGMGVKAATDQPPQQARIRALVARIVGVPA
jgi:hypothetical protein